MPRTKAYTGGGVALRAPRRHWLFQGEVGIMGIMGVMGMMGEWGREGDEGRFGEG